MMEWQPIENAPKGKPILVSYILPSGIRKTRLAELEEDTEIWFWEDGIFVPDKVIIFAWMPLPAPPITTQS